ncbi:uncharacterized protein LOC122859448 isoform X2 [Aphidius gifuensis]|uniref:uncharacterized protein LOC122859448 isoform X2 n=1 Tax=Aphidius gifuensis TaxID=684658 RepID=UPI001CDB8C09|nr:uncharacterized protein LOC122859448 isoform X2 [Aphidius gifuensis]
MMVSTTTQPRIVFVVGLFIAFFAISLQVVQSDEQSDSVISEVQCRPYIEKALKGREAGSVDEGNVDEKNYVESPHSEEKKEDEAENEDEKASLEAGHDVKDSGEDSKESGDTEDLNKSNESNEEVKVENEDEESKEKNYQSVESAEQNQSNEDSVEANQQHENVDNEQDSKESSVESDENKSSDNGQDSKESAVESNENKSSEDAVKDDGDKTEEEKDDSKSTETVEVEEEKKDSADVSDEIFKTSEETTDTKSDETIEEISVFLENKTEDSSESGEVKSSTENDSKENENGTVESEEKKDESSEEKTQIVDDASEENDQQSERQKREAVDDNKSAEKSEEKPDDKSAEKSDNESEEKPDDKSEEKPEEQSEEKPDKSEEKPDDKSGEKSEEKSGEIVDDKSEEKSEENDGTESKENDKSEENEPTPEEDLIQEIEIPKNLRPREHINQILKLDQDNEEKEAAIQKASDVVLKELKRLYDTAIKPLETLYKYRDLSNRHFGDPEIFSKPLVLLMGPWSGGKSSIINYLLDNEYQPTALRTGAEPSPAYFNILMHGEEQEVLDGTQLAADWTFSGLQKFGQGMLDRLRGLKLNNKLLEKVNIVEIPGILEIRKQVQRLFPFNDACQWFIDRADIIFLVYDPSKLDVGPETEAILDQLKGREYQTRIILNKADQVKPEELMRVQGALIWNISPLMSSAEPPVMYSTSLWSLPYEAGAPTRLLYAQERAFLRDLRSAIDKRVEHKIASARRFAVRVRNHAKMVDCYLTTYFNHKTFFGNKKDTSDKIIESPQDYHIYEGLSTLTNISRYDLPDPDVYRDFFRLNALHEFQPLSSTCTYFRGCPINRLDVAIAYDLPELVGKYRKLVESTLNENNNTNSQQSTS